MINEHNASISQLSGSHAFRTKVWHSGPSRGLLLRVEGRSAP